jgi:hypothetical protein
LYSESLLPTVMQDGAYTAILIMKGS